MLMSKSTHFDKYSNQYDEKKPKYYYTKVKQIYSEIIPPSKKILDIGCGTGEMLAYLEPSIGVGVDVSDEMIKIVKKKYPQFDFRIISAENLVIESNFDYIIMVDLIEHLNSVPRMLERIYKICKSDTVVIASWYNPLWEPIIKFADILKLKMPEGLHHLTGIKKFDYALQTTEFNLIKYCYIKCYCL